MKDEAKLAASKTKMTTFELSYGELENKDRDKKFYRLAKAREGKDHDLDQVKCI